MIPATMYENQSITVHLFIGFLARLNEKLYLAVFGLLQKRPPPHILQIRIVDEFSLLKPHHAHRHFPNVNPHPQIRRHFKHLIQRCHILLFHQRFHHRRPHPPHVHPRKLDRIPALRKHESEHLAHQILSTHALLHIPQNRGAPKGEEHHRFHPHRHGARSNDKGSQHLVQISAKDDDGDPVIDPRLDVFNLPPQIRHLPCQIVYRHRSLSDLLTPCR